MYVHAKMFYNHQHSSECIIPVNSEEHLKSSGAMKRGVPSAACSAIFPSFKARGSSAGAAAAAAVPKLPVVMLLRRSRWSPSPSPSSSSSPLLFSSSITSSKVADPKSAILMRLSAVTNTVCVCVCGRGGGGGVRAACVCVFGKMN
jgi:hypothetical protein